MLAEINEMQRSWPVRCGFHVADDLWEACTDPERLARWIAKVSGDLQVGGSIHAVFTSRARWAELTPTYEQAGIA